MNTKGSWSRVRDHEAWDDGYTNINWIEDMDEKTQDGKPLKVGQTIWAKHFDGRPPSRHVVKKIFQNKIEYVEPDSEGYVGIKRTGVFHYKKNAK